MTKPKKKVGAQRGNCNALRHGGYSKRFKPDSPAGRLVNWIQATLSTSFPDPSPQQVLILKGAATKAFRCDSIAREILRCNGDVPERLDIAYLKWSNSLTKDLLALGLEKQARNVTNLQQYLEGKA